MKCYNWISTVLHLVVVMSLVIGPAFPAQAAPASPPALPPARRSNSQADTSLPQPLAEALEAFSDSALASRPSLIPHVSWPEGLLAASARRQALTNLNPLSQLPSWAWGAGSGMGASAETSNSRSVSGGLAANGSEKGTASRPSAWPDQVNRQTSPANVATSDPLFSIYLPLIIQSDSSIASGPISPETGGYLASANGQVTIRFAPHAVNVSATGRYSEIAPRNLPPSLRLVSRYAFELSAQEQASNTSIAFFPPQVTTSTVYNAEFNSWPVIYAVTPTVDIDIHYSDTDVAGLQENRLRVYRQDPTTGAWKTVPTVVDTENNVAQVTVERSGRLALLGWPISNPAASSEFGALSAIHAQAGTQVVILDPDHGGRDLGGTVTEAGYEAEEKNYNLQVALLVRDNLRMACGLQVDMTREDDSDVTPVERVDIINTTIPDAAVSLAFDIVHHYMGDSTVTGTGTAAWVDPTKPIQSTFGLAGTRRVHEFTGLRDRGTRDGRDRFYVITHVDSAITYTHLELAFMDNYDDRVIMDDPVGMGGIAGGVTMAIVDVLGGTSTCDPNLLPAPLSAEYRARLRAIGIQNSQRRGMDPVANTGNQVQQFTDWAVPGVGSFDFMLQRTYNSLDARDGLFGFGWSSWLDMYLRLANDGSVDVRRPDGSGVYFVPAGADFAPGQDGVFDALMHNGPDYLLKTPDQMFYHFQVFGLRALLTGVNDRRGNSITIQRDADGRATSITDSAGRIYTLTYDGNHIASITDVSGRDVVYTYEGNGDLRSVKDANDGVYQFEYDDHRLTKLTDPENILYLQNFYDGSSGKVIEQIDANGSHSYIAYGDHEITFTDNLGNKTIHRFDDLFRVTETEDDLGQKEKFIYDADYNVTQYTDKRNNTWTFTYDPQGNLLTATDPLLHTTTYTYNSTNDLTSITDLGGPGDTPRITTFVYDGDGNLTDILRPDGTTIHATYDAHGQMLTLTDGNGHTTEYIYDAQGNLTEVIDPEGNHTLYEYDAMGRQIKMTDANGHTVEFKYDDNDNITQIIDPKGRSIYFTYDLNDNLTKMVDRRGGETIYDYDDNLKLIAETDPMSHTVRYGYDLMYNRTVMTDALGNVTLYRYDDLYRLEEVEDALHGITRFGYDPNDNITSVTDALNQTTTFGYDELNRLTKQIDALLGVTTFEYDAVSHLTRVVNPRLAPTEYEYDLLDRLALVRDALNGEWEIGYDDDGNVTSTTDANGHTVTLRYDNADRLIEHIDAGSHPTYFEPDGVGNTLTVTDALGRVTHYTYDENDNLETITDTLGGVTSMEYDEEDNLIALTDANHHTAHFAYDLDGLLIALTEARGQATTFQYDDAHNLTEYINAKGNAWRYEYDELNRRIRETDLLGHLTTYRYDALSRLTHITDANNITTRYDYDALDRLTDVVQNEAPGALADHQTNVTTHYDYDPVGNLLAITDANGETTTFDYDLLDRLTKETNPLSRIWRYEYDPVGNLTARTDANGQTTHYTYDADDLLTRILYPDSTDITFGYDAVHNQTSMTDSLGATLNEYDALNRLTASTNHVGQRVEYGYDAVGNRTRLTYPDGRTMRYEYDQTNFASRVIDPDGNIFSVTRDATHNITRIDYPNQTQAEYDIDAAERLTAVRNLQADGDVISAIAYTLDPVGNRTRVEGVFAWRNPPELNFDYAYDSLYRLIRSEDNEGHFTEYAYDAVGNRLRRTTNDDPTLTREIDTITTLYTYDAANELITSVRDLLPRGNADRGLQTAQILRAFAHEVEAQDSKHIESGAAADLLAQANSLIAALEGSAPPSESEVADALDALRADAETAGSGGSIDNAGVVNSLLVKLERAGDANARRGGEALVTLYNYDLNGNRIRRTMPDEGTGSENDWLKTEYAYEFENRLAHVQDFHTPGSPDAEAWLPGDETFLTYDGYGRVFRRQHDQHASTTLSTGGGDQMWVDYVYDGLDPIVEYDNPDPQYVNYYRGLGRILNMRQNARGGEGDGTVYYFHHDGLGSVSALTKHNGQSPHTYRYHDYGIILDVNGKATDASNFTDPHNHFTYTGQEWDERLELFHFYAREYEPETGVWLQQDPYRGRLDMPVSLQRYGYVGGNPVNYRDRYGYSPLETLWDLGTTAVEAGKIIIETLIDSQKREQAKKTGWHEQHAELGRRMARNDVSTRNAALFNITWEIVEFGLGEPLKSHSFGEYWEDTVVDMQAVMKPIHERGPRFRIDPMLYIQDVLLNKAYEAISKQSQGGSDSLTRYVGGVSSSSSSVHFYNQVRHITQSVYGSGPNNRKTSKPGNVGCDSQANCPKITPTPPVSPSPSPTFCTINLEPRDLGGGNPFDRNFVVEATLSDLPSSYAIYYQGNKMDLVFHGPFEKRLRWGVSTLWAYFNAGWMSTDRWTLQYACGSK